MSFIFSEAYTILLGNHITNYCSEPRTSKMIPPKKDYYYLVYVIDTYNYSNNYPPFAWVHHLLLPLGLWGEWTLACHLWWLSVATRTGLLKTQLPLPSSPAATLRFVCHTVSSAHAHTGTLLVSTLVTFPVAGHRVKWGCAVLMKVCKLGLSEDNEMPGKFRRLTEIQRFWH